MSVIAIDCDKSVLPIKLPYFGEHGGNEYVTANEDVTAEVSVMWDTPIRLAVPWRIVT